MKPISPALKSHIEGEVTTLSTCWKATLKNGTVYGFTDNINDLFIDGINFTATSGYTASNIETSSDLAVDNLEIQGVLDSNLITEDDILAGVWDFAQIEIFQVNYNDLSQGKLYLRSGEIGIIKSGRSAFVAELRGLMQKYSNIIGEITTVTCRAEFCDNRCTLDINSFTFAGSVTSVTNNRIFTDSSRTEDTGFFEYGKIDFLTGNNAGLSMEVKAFTFGGLIELALAMPYEIQTGDTFNIIAGCSKTVDSCKSYNNIINFRGEPHVPGQDKAFIYGNK
jgi:uncharacterized phage protein (TIGR02218 family)